MKRWHEKISGKIGLRVAGLAFLASAWTEGGWLRSLVTAHPKGAATFPQLLLAGLMFVSASFGMALAIIGAGLWKTVMVSKRWEARAGPPAR